MICVGFTTGTFFTEVEIAAEDLLSPPSHSHGGTLRSHHSTHISRALRPSLIRADADSDTLSVHSLRASVLSKSIGPGGRELVGLGTSSRARGDAASIRSMSRNTGAPTRTRNQSTPTSTGSLTRANVAAHVRAQLDADGERPDSKLTPDDGASVRSMRSSATEKARARAHRKSSSASTLTNTDATAEPPDGTRAHNVRDGSAPSPSHSGRPQLSKIVTTSTASVRSTTSTSTRKSLAPSAHSRSRVRPPGGTQASSTSRYNPTGLSTLRIPGTSRPSSTLSTTSETSTFLTAQSEILTPTSTGSGGSGGSASGARSRKISTGSTVSTVSVRTVGTSSRAASYAQNVRERERQRVSSGVSVNSAATRPSVRRPPTVAEKDVSKISPHSTSRRLPAAGAATPVARATPLKGKSISRTASDQGSSKISPRLESKQLENDKGDKNKTRNKNKENRAPGDTEQQDTCTPAKTGVTVDVDGMTPPPEEYDQITNGGDTLPTSDIVLARRGSSDTITATYTPATPTSDPPPTQPLTSENVAPLSPPGASLEIGIPCIISSKRRRFRAFARYIGEVLGEHGPWVGVEVPVGSGDTWVGDLCDGRAWCDGTWGGVRYFDIGGCGSEWEFGDTNLGRSREGAKRRLDGVNGLTTSYSSGNLKREGDQLFSGMDRSKRLRSSSPAGSDMSTSESRGLFVRPQQVLYVVDAVGADL